VSTAKIEKLMPTKLVPPPTNTATNQYSNPFISGGIQPNKYTPKYKPGAPATTTTTNRNDQILIAKQKLEEQKQHKLSNQKGFTKSEYHNKVVQ
jgi:hypothetical protein